MSPRRKRWGFATVSRPQASDDRQALASRDTLRGGDPNAARDRSSGKLRISQGRPESWNTLRCSQRCLSRSIPFAGVVQTPFLTCSIRLLLLRQTTRSPYNVPDEFQHPLRQPETISGCFTNRLPISCKRRADCRKEHLAGAVRLQPLSLVKLICETQPLTFQLEGLDDETHE